MLSVYLSGPRAGLSRDVIRTMLFFPASFFVNPYARNFSQTVSKTSVRWTSDLAKGHLSMEKKMHEQILIINDFSHIIQFIQIISNNIHVSFNLLIISQLSTVWYKKNVSNSTGYTVF